MKIKFSDKVYWALAVLPLVVTGIVFSDFPQAIPTHFNALGKADRYGSRAELLIFPLAGVGFAVAFWFFFKFIHKNADNLNERFIQVSKLLIAALFAATNIMILVVTYRTVNAQSVPDLYRILAFLLGLGDMVLANYLPKCRRNGWIGIRTAWTLKSDEVWYKTHRFGGRLMAAGGIVCIAASVIFKGIVCLLAVFLLEAAILALVVVYSYRVAKRKESVDE